MTFEDEDIPNVNENPLSNHGGPRVNAMESSLEMQVKRNVKDVRMSMKLVHEVIIKVGKLESRQKKKEEIKDQKNASAGTMGVLRIILSKSAQTSSS